MQQVLTLSNTGNGLKITINSFLAFIFLPFTLIGWWNKIKNIHPFYVFLHGIFQFLSLVFWFCLLFFIIDYYFNIHVPFLCWSILK